MKAVIFDMDGVLVDSYRAHFESWRLMAAEEGHEITEAQFAASFGRTSREVIRSWWGDRYDDRQTARLDDRKEDLYREILAADFPSMDGAQELLGSLRRAGFLLAIGSSGPPENIELCVDRLGGPEQFGAIVSANDVTRGKPDPQVFLLAADRLGARPAECVVVEDAPLGVEAARKAGMAVVAVASTGRTRESLARADFVVNSLRGITPEKIDRLIDGRSCER
jgi:beta-phosphoglucomutase